MYIKFLNKYTFYLFFSLQNDVNLRHKIFLNLYFRLRKTIIQNLETRGYSSYFIKSLKKLENLHCTVIFVNK